MMQAATAGILSLILVIAMPAILLAPVEAEPIILVKEQTEEEIMIDLQTGNAVIRMPLEEYLTGVVLSEMPASFDEEALKAQAVAARTFAIYRMEHEKHEGYDLCADSTCCQAWSDYASITEKIGASLWSKGESAVRQTKQEVMTYHGELIESVYFSCSGGATEAAVAVWGSEVPYLQSVTSAGEEYASKYKNETIIANDVFCEKIREENSAVTFENTGNDWIGETVYTQGGGVERIKIGGQWFAGTQVRKIFGLNSAKFSVLIEDGNVVFEVYGNGHRVGMSQYGANAMAQNGKNYKEILNHYYTDISIERWDGE